MGWFGDFVTGAGRDLSNGFTDVFGKDNSAINNTNQFFTSPGAAAGDGINSAFGKPAAPGIKSPNAISQTPSLAETNTTALQNKLAQEKMEASTSTMLTGGQGLLDEPTTTSSILMGY